MNFNFIHLNSVDNQEITKKAFKNNFNTTKAGTIKWIVAIKLLLLNINENINNPEKINEILQNFYDVQYNKNTKEELYNSYVHEKDNKIHDLIKKYRGSDDKNALEILNDIDNEINKKMNALKYKFTNEENYHTNMHVEEIYVRLLILAIYNDDNVKEILELIFKIMTNVNNSQNNSTVYSLIPFNNKYINSEILYMYAVPYWLAQIEFNLNGNNIDSNVISDLNGLKALLEKKEFNEITKLRCEFEYKYPNHFTRDDSKTSTLFRCLGSLDAIKDLESGLLEQEFEMFNNFINDKTKSATELDNLISKVSQKVKYIFNMMTIGTIYVDNIHDNTENKFDIRSKAIMEFLNNGYITNNDTIMNNIQLTKEVYDKLCLTKYFEKNLEKKDTKDNKNL